MITQREVSTVAYRAGMSDRVIEKDYVLTWLLCGIAESPVSRHLAFKGGTALKKIYYAGYRYSEDLDFTLTEDVDPGVLLAELSGTLDQLARQQGFQFEVPEDRIERRDSSLTAYVNFVGPLQARLTSRDVKVDFTLSERLLFPIDARAILSDYSDHVDRAINSYSLEEVITEKLCALIGRTEPRDLYDLHFLFGQPDIDFHLIPHAFGEKAESKGVDASRLAEVLERKRPTLQRMWETRLTHQVKELPHLEQVLRELTRSLRGHGLLDL